MQKNPMKNPEEMKRKILVSAAKNFAKNGYAGTSLKDITTSAKISKGGLYHHFSNKEDLFVAVCIENVNNTMKKTKEFFAKKRSIQPNKDDTLFDELSEFYDNIVVGSKDLERLWIEGMMESEHNMKLKKMLLKMEKETSEWGFETLKQVRDSTELLTGYSNSELKDITNGFSAIYKGILVDRLMGKNPKDVRRSWIQTVYAIYNSKNNLKK